MTGYTDTIRKYASDDSRTGLLHQADGTGEVGLSSAEAGRKLAVRFTLQVSNNKIKRARYQVFGCGFTIAACAIAAELIEGQNLCEIYRVDAAAINRGLGGLPDERSYCADLAVEAMQAAVGSVRSQASKVVATICPKEQGHKPLVTANNPIFRALISSPGTGAKPADRYLFSSLLAAAEQESAPLHQALGLTELNLDRLLTTIFPQLDRAAVFSNPDLKKGTPPEINPEILTLLLSYTDPRLDREQRLLPEALAHIIAARAAHPGHLWIAMGLFERPQLSAAIGRHLPRLLKTNNKGMRWKRFLFKQLCEQSGGMMCKSPNCQDCSDYMLCFGE